MHPFLVAAAYAPYLGYLWLTGHLSGISAIYPFGLKDPAGALKTLTSIGHLLSVLLGAGIVVAAYDAGRTLWGSRTGVVASVFVATLYPMFYYSRTGNVDVPMLFFIALTLAAFARSLVRGLTTLRAIGLGTFAGLALGTKEQALAAFLPIPLVLLALQLRDPARNAWRTWTFWKPFAVALIAAFLAFGLGSGLFVAPERYFAHLAFARQRMQELTSGKLIFIRMYPSTFEGNLQLAGVIGKYLLDTLTLPGLLLAFLGILWAVRRERRTATFALPALTYLAVLFITARTAQLRYVLPAAYSLTFFGARAAVAACESPRALLRYAGVVAIVATIGLNLQHGMDLTNAMIRDSRYAAARWLEAHARPGDRLEYFGIPWKLPELSAGVTIHPAAEFHGGSHPIRTDAAAVQWIVQGWARRQPEFIVTMPDYTSAQGSPHSAVCPEDVYQGLLAGAYGYELAATFETPPIVPWLRRPPLDYPTVNPPIRIFVKRKA